MKAPNLTTEQLKKLTTARLLAYFKAKRKHYYRLIGSNTCDCCGERMSDLYPNDPHYKVALQEEKDFEKYLEEIKSVLAAREHVHKPGKK